MERFSMTIGGQQVAGEQASKVVNPATGEEFALAPSCTQDELDRAMRAAREAQPAWAADEDARREALRAAAKAVSSAASRLGGLVTAEQGKPLALAIGEAYASGGSFRHYAEMELAPQVLQDDKHGYAELARKPHGVVAAITPWNFPVAIAAAKLAPALRAGNTVVLKPSPHTPLATLMLGQLLSAALPAGVVNVVSGGDDIGAAMVTHPVTAQISFTGSIEAGRKVAAAAGTDIKRYVLELGGNDPGIVLDDADPDEMAERLFWDSFANNGQACLLIKRLYVPQRLYGRVVDALADRARAARVGIPTDKGVQLGPLANRPQFDRVRELVHAAVTGGATVAAGGKALGEPGFFYAPTILSDVDDGTPIVDEEQFGPVLPVVSYVDLDDAVRRANASHYGLGGSVWSADPSRAWDVAQRLECGSVWVNAHAVLRPDQPIAGLKCSGIGVENGPLGLAEYTALQVRHRPPRR